MENANSCHPYRAPDPLIARHQQKIKKTLSLYLVNQGSNVQNEIVYDLLFYITRNSTRRQLVVVSFGLIKADEVCFTRK